MIRFFIKLYYAPRMAWLLSMHWQGRWFVFRDEKDGILKFIASTKLPETDKHMGTFIREARIELAKREAKAKQGGE